MFTLVTDSFTSQYGSISGYFLDEHFEALPGGDIAIEGTNQTIESDDNGYYKIMGVSSGTYTLKFMFVGYAPALVHNVKVLSDSDTEIVICLNLSEMDYFGNNYDGSNAKITPYNPSQKNIDLEKTGKVDIKEKSKYHKLDFAERIHLLQKDKERALPKFNSEDIIGIYQTSPDGYFEFKMIDGDLYMNLYDITSYIRNDSFRLYHKGNNIFFTKEMSGEIIFKNNTLNFQINNPHFWIKPEKIFQKSNYDLKIPRLLAVQGKSDEAINLYRILLLNNPKSYYTNDDYYRSIQYYLIKNNLFDAAIIIGKVNVEFNSDRASCYYDLAEVYIKKNEIESAIETYKSCLNKAKYLSETDILAVNSIIRDLEKKLNDNR